MITYQDYERAVAENRLLKWLGASIINYRNSTEYKEAERQELYILGRNPDIMNALRVIYSATGVPLRDFTAANHRIASKKCHRFVAQRCTYSLGNGISFTKHPHTQASTVTVLAGSLKRSSDAPTRCRSSAVAASAP